MIVQKGLVNLFFHGLVRFGDLLFLQVFADLLL